MPNRCLYHHLSTTDLIPMCWVEAAVKIAVLVLDLPLFNKKDITIMCILPQAVGVSFKMRPSELLAADSHVVELL